jgi:hypothetical protein
MMGKNFTGVAGFASFTRFKRFTLTSCLGLASLGAFAGTQPAASRLDYANASYLIEHENVQLVHGKRSVAAAPGSATRHVTRIVGQPAFGRLGVRRAAAVFLLDSPGGSGSFFYAAATFGDGRTMPSIFLGDRIKPQSMAFQGDEVVVRYLDRKADEPMVAKPTVPKTMRLSFDVETNRLVALTPGVATGAAGKSGD